MAEGATRRLLIFEKKGSYYLAMGKDQGGPITPADLPKDYKPEEWWEDWGQEIDSLEELHQEIDRLLG